LHPFRDSDMQIPLGLAVGRANAPAAQTSVMYQNGAPSLDFSVLRRPPPSLPLLLPVPPARVAISSCCVLNSPRRAVPRVCIYGPSEEEKFLTSPRRWLGMHSRRLKTAGKGPASAATIVAQQRRSSRKRRNSLGFGLSARAVASATLSPGGIAT